MLFFLKRNEHFFGETYRECPFRVDWHSDVPAKPTDQILTVSSKLPLTSLVPSLFHATDVTGRECPVRGDPMGAPRFTSHSMTVLSLLQLAIVALFGLEADTQDQA